MMRERLIEEIKFYIYLILLKTFIYSIQIYHLYPMPDHINVAGVDPLVLPNPPRLSLRIRLEKPER